MIARLAAFVVFALLALAAPPAAAAQPDNAPLLSEQELAARVPAPYRLGARLTEDGVHEIIDLSGRPAGYIFETRPLAPIPGFSGAPIDLLVTLDGEGRFVNVELIDHNEPVFVSGLGEAPFHKFVEQYRGRSIAENLTVGVPYGAQGGAGSGAAYLDGVTKATASVRIAHESILAAAFAVARERMKGLRVGPPRAPDPDHDEKLDWAALEAQGLAGRLTVTNRQLQEAFAGSLWEDDDPEAAADPDGVFLDLWVVDVGPPALARAALAPETLAELRAFLAVSDHDEPLLVIDAGRHGLVSDDFVRNTAPDLITLEQDGLPIALRDADLEVQLAPGGPEAARAMILRTDRRLGFDPARPWTLRIAALRRHGPFMPEIGARSFELTHVTPERFFRAPQAAPAPAPPWVEAALARRVDLAALAVVLLALFAALGPWMRRLAASRLHLPARLAFLAAMIVFVGWHGQGQLSIVTALGALRAAVQGGGFAFLLYDPFSLMIWGAAILGFVLWGRGLFCGWLCPYGAMQELAHHAGRAARLPRLRVAEGWDRRLKLVKYAVLAVLAAAALISPSATDALVEVEPFKTAVTVGFDREWPYVLYAAFWLALGAALFKGFCRYVCPLGALMALGGLLRGRDWIARRAECGSPCQLCRAKCPYQAIEKSGRIRYDECFACLDCVSIYEDPARCVPRVLAARKAGPRRQAPVAASSAAARAR
ncbi:4Fe-4S binding protein [Oceanicella actignis]|uniref:4Fe-4S binding protein n=1 Tax=Oceanicella actignis TaxID=1189325 RepID=UPI0011E8678E|nr:4Fe-4S binding protein [Oceanicella actignis]TYO89512.1 transcriptional regulator of nitric oxide reductase [Oceanicella actignis]